MSRRSITFVFLVMLLVMGCSNQPPIYLGSPIRTDRLADLVVGKSTENDIRAALGPPLGQGAWRNSAKEVTQNLRVYEYDRINNDQVNVEILLVMVKNGVYQGHFWFGADELVQRTAGIPQSTALEVAP